VASCRLVGLYSTQTAASGRLVALPWPEPWLRVGWWGFTWSEPWLRGGWRGFVW